MEKSKEKYTWQENLKPETLTPELRYKLSTFFGFVYLKNFERKEEQELRDRLYQKKEQFIEICEKMNEAEKERLATDWIQNLNKLKKFQKEDYHVIIIDKLIEEIKSESLELDLFPNGDDPDPDGYFRSIRARKLFEKYHKDIITNFLAEYSFLYNWMKDDGLLIESKNKTEFKDWLMEKYNVDLKNPLYSKGKVVENLQAHRVEKYDYLIKECEIILSKK